MGKNAFLDPVTHMLKTWGYVESNEPGDIRLPVTESFNFEIRKWKFEGEWLPFTPPVVVDPKVKAIEDLKALDPNKATVKDVLVLLKEAL